MTPVSRPVVTETGESSTGLGKEGEGGASREPRERALTTMPTTHLDSLAGRQAPLPPHLRDVRWPLPNPNERGGRPTPLGPPPSRTPRGDGGEEGGGVVTEGGVPMSASAEGRPRP